MIDQGRLTALPARLATRLRPVRAPNPVTNPWASTASVIDADRLARKLLAGVPIGHPVRAPLTAHPGFPLPGDTPDRERAYRAAKMAARVVKPAPVGAQMIPVDAPIARRKRVYRPRVKRRLRDWLGRRP